MRGLSLKNAPGGPFFIFLCILFKAASIADKPYRKVDMSKALFDARRKLSSVGSLLKQDKIGNAVHALVGGLQDMLRESLLKSERSEFERLVQSAVDELNYNKTIQTKYSLRFEYKPGGERELLEDLRFLMEELEASDLESADRLSKELEVAKKARLSTLGAQLAANNTEAARDSARNMLEEFNDDANLMVDMAEFFEQSGLLEDAVVCLERARKLDPGAVYILNKLGINFRKLRNFEDSEYMFQKAAGLTPDDPNLHFNLGRLYVDWEKWPEAHKSAQKALELEPGFEVAGKMSDYAAKRM